MGDNKMNFQRISCRPHSTFATHLLSVLIAIFGCTLSASTLFAADESSKVQALKTYLQIAFAQTDNLIKPEQKPVVFYKCPNVDCLRTIELLSLSVGSDFVFSKYQSESDQPLILVIFRTDTHYASEGVSIVSQVQHARIRKTVDQRCRVANAVQVYAVRKIVIEVAQSEGTRANTFCILNGMVMGSGLAYKESYEEYANIVRQQSEDYYQAAIWGTAAFLVLHWDGASQPGDTRVQVEDKLRAMMGIK
jgi:hypothetical protein